MTIRRRLLLGILASLALLITLIGAVEFIALRGFLYQRTADRLHDEARLVLGGVVAPADGTGGVSTGQDGNASCPGTVVLPNAHGSPLIFIPSDRALAIAHIFATRGIASAVVDSDGSVLACAPSQHTATSGSFNVPGAVFNAPASSAGSGGTTLDSGGRHLLALTVPVRGGGAVILASELSEDDATLRTVVIVTLVGGVGALLLAAALCFPLLRGALAPLRTVARAADAIAAGDLGQRADLARTDDEVGRLGAAFDRMIDRLQASSEAQQRLVEQLRDKEEAMRRLLADASHELRTPLTSIRGGAQVLLRGGADDTAYLSESLGHIGAESERMSRLIDDLLLLSRLEETPERVHESLDLGALVAGAQARWEAFAPGHPLDVTTGPAEVEGEADALLRACTNLVDNAAKYSPAGSPIQVTVGVVDGSVELSVRDHGPGIPEADRERVFERFYRGDPARARNTGGSGLGLAIVRGIAEEHGGTAVAADAPGGGARITLRFPAASGPAPSDQALAEPAAGRAAPARERGRPPTIPSLGPHEAAPPA